ncbi:hypothetical protein MOD31_09715 [Paenarthrobacter sp. TYUT067]|uniref:hypothetical protein n=1 Tax=Paenarthrobacter sp. TYUT067 TaxID=2926245 RepID=UPI00202FF314|nr:hypothetical protein [Paenarthrobacter sp. TYUT067]MCM0616300.1 hypothetical protein [Paenarthrobacter sp. TYUT067]
MGRIQTHHQHGTPTADWKVELPMARRSARKAQSITEAVPGRRGPRKAIWLIAAGLVAGIAGGVFGFRMLVPSSESEPAKTPRRQPEEILVREEPVEISTRMRPGEWTEESLQEHLEDYKQQIRDMGAKESQIVVDVERTEAGAARVVVSWDRTLP